jgi:hypothetical protein
MSVRRKLDETSDSVVLASAGRLLALNARDVHLDFDHVALGRTYSERALRIDPQSRTAGETVAMLDALARNAAVAGILKSKDAELPAAMNDAERFSQLPQLAASLYMGAENLEYTHHDTAGANASWARSKAYAQAALSLAPSFKDSPDYGRVVRNASLTLGTHALREGDRKSAVRYLAEASNVDARPSFYLGATLEMRLVVGLLKAGERESVAIYLEKTASSDLAVKDEKLEAATAIRAGRMPAMYQAALSQ